MKNSNENIDLKELETIAALYLEHTAFHGAESCKPIVETDIHVISFYHFLMTWKN